MDYNKALLLLHGLSRTNNRMKRSELVLNNSNRTQELIEVARKYVNEHDEELEAPEKIQIVIVEPEKKPYTKWVDNTLDEFQKIVGGYVENLFIGESEIGARVGIMLNEEGKLDNLPLNRNIVGLDFLVGTFFITAYNYEGYNISLTNKECDYYIKCFSGFEIYL